MRQSITTKPEKKLLTDVVTYLGLELLQDSGLVVVVGVEQLVVRLEQVQKMTHPSGDVVLEELRKVLVVEVVKNPGDLNQRPEDDLQRHLEI